MCNLTSKYNIPSPRYTSYPTVPYWDHTTFSMTAWKRTLTESFDASNVKGGISLYIHLPFCEHMCTFCGCTKRITKNHSVEIPYIKAVLKEFQLYAKLFKDRPIITKIHLGGGTPTFFSPEHLNRLLSGLFAIGKKGEHCDFSFEGHPNNTTKNHLKMLTDHGFTKVCYGVQDYSDTVQKAINRVQPFSNVQNITLLARELGYTSVGHDIIYGLPFQNQNDIVDTVQKTISLRPDRIAFYSYAHVPWIKGNGQRGFKDTDLPNASQKREFYEMGKTMLLEAGYIQIGMDHFALGTDPLSKASKKMELHRNFMGYTTKKTPLLLGLGVSAISDSSYSFAQNVKSVEEYQKLVDDDILPLSKGHILNREDQIVREHIDNIMCHFKTSWEKPTLVFPELSHILIQLKELENDGLLTLHPKKLIVTEKGKPFVRTICKSFDLRLQRKKPDTALFSMAI